MWRDWFLDIFFKKFLLPSTMVLFFHSFGGGRCFILVFLDPSSFLCHSILFQGTDFPLSFQKSPLPLTITTCFHTWTRAARSISLQNPSLPSLIPCWGIDSIYLLKSLLCHPSLFSRLYFWGDWVPYFFQNTILASFDGVALPTSLHYSSTLLDFLSEGLLSL